MHACERCLQAQVRRLICVCLSRFYLHADMMGIYPRVSGLQSALTGRGPGGLGGGSALSDTVRHAVMDVLAYMTLHHGRQLSAAAPESLAIASKW
jgi:hypothetical protein